MKRSDFILILTSDLLPRKLKAAKDKVCRRENSAWRICLTRVVMPPSAHPCASQLDLFATRCTNRCPRIQLRSS